MNCHRLDDMSLNNVEHEHLRVLDDSDEGMFKKLVEDTKKPSYKAKKKLRHL